MFLSAADLPRVSSLIFDYKRNSAYLDFLKNNVKDKVIVDCGSGSGIWTWVSLYYGASHVYAVDIDLETVDHLNKLFGNNKNVTVLNLNLHADTLPIGDIYVHEMFGDNIFSEGLMRFLKNCHKQNIKTIYPNKIKLFSLTNLTSENLNNKYNFENLDPCLNEFVEYISETYKRSVDKESFIKLLYSKKVTANKNLIWEGDLMSLVDMPSIKAAGDFISWDACLNEFEYSSLNENFNNWPTGYVKSKEFQHSYINCHRTSYY